MNLLDFLVTSQTRKALLRLLWGEKVEASGHQLAQLAGGAYSAVHSELEAMRKEGLLTSREEGRAVVLRKNDNYRERRALLALLGGKKQSVRPAKVRHQEVLLNLAKFGAPLAVHGESKLDLPLEESLVSALRLSRHDATVARTLPVVFAKNENDLDLPRLEFLARQEGVLSVLGFFLDLTAALSKSRKLHMEARRLLDHRRKRSQNFFVHKKMNEFEDQLAERNTPAVARDWHFRLNMGMDSFESLFNKHRSGIEERRS